MNEESPIPCACPPLDQISTWDDFCSTACRDKEIWRFAFGDVHNGTQHEWMFPPEIAVIYLRDWEAIAAQMPPLIERMNGSTN